MNGQLDLLSYVPPASLVRVHDRDTSRIAARRTAEPGRLAEGQTLALACIGCHDDDGATDFELADCSGRQQTSIGKRRLELLRAGLVEDTGNRRPSPTGTPSICWRLTPDGVRAWLDLCR